MPPDISHIVETRFFLSNLFSKCLTALTTLLFTLIFSQISPAQENDILKIEKERSSQEISSYLSDLDIRTKIGQLIVAGFPVIRGKHTIHEYLNNSGIQNFIDLKIGNIYFSYYHYLEANSDRDPDDVINDIRGLHQEIRRRYKEAGLPPPLIFVDYETPTMSSFSRQYSASFPAPIPPLTLSSSRSPSLIKKYGQNVAKLMHSLGVDVLLNPVLDIDVTPQGQRNELVSNRCFGGTAEIVCKAAWSYLSGLKAENMIIVAKHFPGRGAVVEQEYEKNFPILCGENNIHNSLIPFRVFGKYTDGFMSTHISLPALSPMKLITFDQSINKLLLREHRQTFQQLNDLGLEDIVLLSDDLSCAQSITKYCESIDTERHRIAEKAIDAGHDMLLFTRPEFVIPETIETPSSDRFKCLNIGDIDAMMKNLVAIYKSSPGKDSPYSSQTITQIDKALNRIIALKAKAINSWTVAHRNPLSSWALPASTPIRIDSKSIYLDILERATLCIAGDKDVFRKYQLGAIIMPPDRKPMQNTFATTQFHLEIQDGRILNKDRIVSIASDAVNNSKVVAYIYSGKKYDEEILEAIYKSTIADPEKQKHFTILAHATPKWLPHFCFYRFNIIGNFMDSDIAYEIDADIISQKRTPHPISQIPISLSIYQEPNAENLLEDSESAMRVLIETQTNSMRTNRSAQQTNVSDSFPKQFQDEIDKTKSKYKSHFEAIHYRVWIVISLCYIVLYVVSATFFLKTIFPIFKEIDIKSEFTVILSVIRICLTTRSNIFNLIACGVFFISGVVVQSNLEHILNYVVLKGQ